MRYAMFSTVEDPTARLGVVHAGQAMEIGAQAEEVADVLEFKRKA